MKYIFMTDASCDLTEELVKEIGIRVIPMEFEIDDFDHTSKMWFLPEEEFQVELKEWNKLKKTFAKMIERQSYWMDQIDKEETK